jgi:hypothetical protein
MQILDQPILWYCLVILAIGVAAMFAIYKFGELLARARLLEAPQLWPEFLHRLFELYEKQSFRSNMPQHFVNANAEWLQKRNEFWTTYVQVLIAALIVIVLAILLLTKTISAEAGLPILSAVSGFAIAKSASTNRVGNDRDTPQ